MEKCPGGPEHISRWSWMLLSSRGAPQLLGMLELGFHHEQGARSLPVCADLQGEAKALAHVATSSLVMKRIILD